MAFKPGISGNPGGRPKGAISHDDVLGCIMEAIARSQNKKDKLAALTSFYAGGIKNRKITADDAINHITRLLPQQVETKNVDNVKINWPGAKDNNG